MDLFIVWNTQKDWFVIPISDVTVYWILLIIWFNVIFSIFYFQYRGVVLYWHSIWATKVFVLVLWGSSVYIFLLKVENHWWFVDRELTFPMIRSRLRASNTSQLLEPSNPEPGLWYLPTSYCRRCGSKSRKSGNK